MIPLPFDYTRATSIEHAVATLGEHRSEAKFLAGGHSLIPLMKLRLASPALVVDIGRLDELRGIREEDGEVVIGALTRHHDIETSRTVRDEVPLLRQVASVIGDPQVRNRGTIGGSLAHGDAAADLPAAVLALDGTLVVEGPGGRRRIPAGDFFKGFLDTAIEADEMIVEIRIPKGGVVGSSYQKFQRRSQDYAIVGAAVVVGSSPRIALANMGPVPIRATECEQALKEGASIEVAAQLADVGTAPLADASADAEYRQHLAKVLVRRGLEEAIGGAG